MRTNSVLCQSEAGSSPSVLEGEGALSRASWEVGSWSTGPWMTLACCSPSIGSPGNCWLASERENGSGREGGDVLSQRDSPGTVCSGAALGLFLKLASF